MGLKINTERIKMAFIHLKFTKLTLNWKKISATLILIFLTGCASMNDLPKETLQTSELPEYVVINKPECHNRDVLTTPAHTVSFPLSSKDQEIIRLLVAKFEQEKNCAGLAAPQIGFDRRIIVFAAPDDPKLKKWRPDLSQTMGQTLWINPSYEGLGEAKFTDYEGCFSVHDLGGPIARFEEITYRAYDANGQLIQGRAKGFLARVIQHEVDHINGRLFIDLVEKDQLLPIAIYRKMRTEAMKKET